MRRILISYILCSLPLSIWAQSSSRWGSLPEFMVTKKVSSKSGLSFQVEPMLQIGDQAINESLQFDERHVRTDLTFFYSYTLNPNWKLAGGLMHRLREGKDRQRTIQQISYSKRSSSLRFGHRFRIDQTFASDVPTVWRLRYRYSLELPLQGADLNDGEFYLISSVELLFISSSDQNTSEQRAAASLGYFMNKKNKFEVGIDYRAGDVFDVLNLHQTWLSLNYFLNL